MGKIKKQGFLQGAMILAVSNLLVKVIGMLFKFPIRRLIGAEGMGIYTSAYNLYNIMFVIATAGLPVAISKMVSESVAKKNWREAYKIYKIANILLITIGVLGSAFLFFGSDILAQSMNLSSSTKAIRALAPSLFFVAVLSVNRGMCQGMSNMVPTAISELIEASGKLFVGLALAYLLLPAGIENSVAGAILGVTIGTCIAAFYIVISNRGVKKFFKDQAKESDVKPRSTKRLFKRLAVLAIPITLGASVFTLASTIDLFMIMHQLEGLGFDEATRKAMYGYYAGDAVTMFNMPPTIITALSVSVVPVIASAFVKKDVLKARQTTETAVRITLLLALPCAVGMSVLAEPILHIIMNDVGAKSLLSVLSFGIIFVCLVLVTNAILQAKGEVWVPVIHMFIGGLVKVIVNYILVGNIDVNINGAPIGTILCYFVTAMLNLISIKKYISPKYGIGYIVKAVSSAVAMGVIVYFAYNFIYSLKIGSTFVMICALGSSVVLGVIVYFSLLLLTRALKKQDIEFMPKSELILKFVGKFLKN